MPIYIQIAAIIAIYIGLIWGFAKVSNWNNAPEIDFPETEWPEMQGPPIPIIQPPKPWSRFYKPNQRRQSVCGSTKSSKSNAIQPKDLKK